MKTLPGFPLLDRYHVTLMARLLMVAVVKFGATGAVKRNAQWWSEHIKLIWREYQSCMCYGDMELGMWLHVQQLFWAWDSCRKVVLLCCFSRHKADYLTVKAMEQRFLPFPRKCIFLDKRYQSSLTTVLPKPAKENLRCWGLRSFFLGMSEGGNWLLQHSGQCFSWVSNQSTIRWIRPIQREPGRHLRQLKNSLTKSLCGTTSFCVTLFSWEILNWNSASTVLWGPVDSAGKPGLRIEELFDSVVVVRMNCSEPKAVCDRLWSSRTLNSGRADKETVHRTDERRKSESQSQMHWRKMCFHLGVGETRFVAEAGNFSPDHLHPVLWPSQARFESLTTNKKENQNLPPFLEACTGWMPSVFFPGLPKREWFHYLCFEEAGMTWRKRKPKTYFWFCHGKT